MNASRQACRLPLKQRGVSLIIVLLLLIAAGFLGSSAAVIALQAEKASRGDRDRQIAFQAAEAAIVDAQLDIDKAPIMSRGVRRAFPFSPESALGFPAVDGAAHCLNTGASRGLCRQAYDGDIPSWLEEDISIATATSAAVPYGFFTGQDFPVGDLVLSARRPQYVIELISYHQPGAETSTEVQSSYFYRITAIGFGADVNTRVVLQAFYRKEN
ncbi:MAG: PilX N-terminal domain-containing pilus assembly protein [Pseudomonadota bacterium]